MELFNLEHIPYYDIGSRQGQTDYIDFLMWDEITEPVMKGIDIYKREFIVIKMIINNIKIMETYFRRYSYSDKWVPCGHATTHFLYTEGGSLSQEQIDLLKKVINNERVLIEKKHKTWNWTYIFTDRYVELYDEKKWNAALVIQKYWRLCRYNPKYKMCERVQLRNFDDIVNSK